MRMLWRMEVTKGGCRFISAASLALPTEDDGETISVRPLRRRGQWRDNDRHCREAEPQWSFP